MDSFYPEDMLVGFFPLVFAINATLEAEADASVDTLGKQQRTVFDRFLDAIAASLVDERDEPEARRPGNRTMSLFRGDDDETSDDEDAVMLEYGSTGGGTAALPRRRAAGFGFGRRPTNNESTPDEAALSYAKALVNGQSFFQRARIVTISTRYGFPPSKDPEGTHNLAFELQNLLNRRMSDKDQAFQQLFAQYPVSGIVPSGWLDKHVHALPSAIMVVCSVCASQKIQAEQDRLLSQTIEHLQYSLVPKRQCSIQVIGLLKDDVTDEQGHEWCQAITHDLVLEDNANTPLTVMVLSASTDLVSSKSDVPSSEPLRRLKRTVRDASLHYYLRQARRTKEKLSKLVGNRRLTGPPPVQLFPLLIRYYFKVAIFYEFQMKYEKSLGFMSEGYRTIVKYYQWLLSRPTNSASTEPASSITSPTHDDRRSNTVRSEPVFDSQDGVEIELTSNTSEGSSNGTMWSRFISLPPSDISHQCRTIADWLNLKILTAGFASHTESGLLAAANQWRVHSRVFASCRSSSKLTIDPWYEWAYITRQRVVASQLVERHPPKVFGDLENGFDDIILRCCPWITYESATEAMLRLALEVERAKQRNVNNSIDTHVEKGDGPRARFVGGVTSDGLRSEFVKECTVNHRQQALDLILRAIAIFERELINNKRGFYAENEFDEKSSSRSGARLYYLAGGILLGMDRHEDAAAHLSKAARYSKGWRELELGVRRLLIESYQKHIPSQAEVDEGRDALVSMILDSYFNAKMSSDDLRKALSHFASISGGESLKWYHETRNEEDTSLPFSFAVSFPGKTHARSGDTVEASVVIKSNLDYAIHVNSVALGTLAGKLPVSAFDLASAVNANEGSDGGIIIQANAAIIVSTKLELPRDLSAIAFDESGNGGEVLGVAGRGSFAKNAKPRTAGLSAAGGARLVSEDLLRRESSNAQGWSVRFLGGKPLLCDGLHVSFYPVQAEKGCSEKVTLIDLTIEKKKMRTAANITRTPFEEENYIASAWSRPQHLPFSRGPRSIRVLGPQPELVISNVTDALTSGKAIEGTVNRILLKLQAGPEEVCSDFNITVTCFSVLITKSMATKRLVSKDVLEKDAENSVDMSNPMFRTPILVTPSDAPEVKSVPTDFSYALPKGWSTAGTGQKCTMSTSPALAKGAVAFVPLDFFRPAAYNQNSIAVENDNHNDDDLGGSSLCKTDFYVTVTYKQQRSVGLGPKTVRTRRISRKLPVMSSSTKDPVSSSTGNSLPDNQDQQSRNDVVYDDATQEYTGSIAWDRPLVASFVAGAKKGCPSGMRHPSNAIDALTSASEECVVAHGQLVSTRCMLELDPSMEGLKTEILSVRFEENERHNNHVGVVLVSPTGKDETNAVIYRSSPTDPSRMLSCGSKLCISYTVSATLNDEAPLESATIPLGCIFIDWRPSPLELPVLPDGAICEDAFGSFKSHGPLALETPSTICFGGPRCYIERAPFDVRPLKSIWPLTATRPFNVQYSVTNRTGLHQVLRIELQESETSQAATSGLLLSGCINGIVTLGPHDDHLISYTVVATRPGEISLPPLAVSSDRYKSWIIKDGPAGKAVFIFP